MSRLKIYIYLSFSDNCHDFTITFYGTLMTFNIHECNDITVVLVRITQRKLTHSIWFKKHFLIISNVLIRNSFTSEWISKLHDLKCKIYSGKILQTNYINDYNCKPDNIADHLNFFGSMNFGMLTHVTFLFYFIHLFIHLFFMRLWRHMGIFGLSIQGLFTKRADVLP